MNDNVVPLCVEFEGALTLVNVLHEQRLGAIKRSSTFLERLMHRHDARHDTAAGNGRPDIDITSLPLHAELLQWLRSQRDVGRRMVLLTDGHRALAEQLAAHLGLFDEVADVGVGGPAAQRSRRALLDLFGESKFDYVGGAATDGSVWQASRRALVVGDAGLEQRVARGTQVERVFTIQRPGIATWIKAVRLHQWVKNGLIFLPALLSHRAADTAVMLKALLAFVAFGCCASSVYIINDLMDLSSDRQHPRKRRRPFASGLLSARAGMVAAMLLLSCSIALSLLVGLPFTAVLAGYYLLTWSYSLRLKRVALLDVMMLAGLYTIRLIAGSAATGIELSFWLMAFSVFVFLSLGFVKRYAELFDARKAGKLSGHGGRGYSDHDLPLIMTLGTAAGYCGVIVMALYINSADSLALYKHHKTLWLVCPLMLFWISRVWMLTSRGHMHDDPVVFALRDRVSLCVLAAFALIVLLAI